MHFVHLAIPYRQKFKHLIFIGICFLTTWFNLQILNFVNQDTSSLLSRSGKCANVHYRKSHNISHKLLRPSQFLEKFMKILEWSTLQK